MIFAVAYDVWPAILADGNRSTVNPHADDVSSTFVVARLLGDCVQLLLKVLDALCLLFNFNFILAIHNIHELLCCVLVLHLRLPPPALTARFQDVDSTALSCCEQRHAIMLKRSKNESAQVLTADVDRAAESCCDLWVELDHEVLLFCELFVAAFDLL